jgi:hypothetical protein
MKKLLNKDHRFLNRALENAVTQQRFEGLNPSAELIEDLEQVVAGQMTIQTVLANIKKRYTSVSISGQ